MRFIQGVIILITRGLILAGKNNGADFHYRGCYRNEKAGNPHILDSFPFRVSTEGGASTCLTTCLNRKLLFFGITQNCTCFCGNSSSIFEQIVEVGESNCGDVCINISTSSFMKVYEVRCMIPYDNSDGYMEVTRTGVSFKCKEGFQLKGRNKLNCKLDGNGSISLDGEPPLCVPAGLSPGLKFVVIIFLLLPPILSIVFVYVTCTPMDSK